KIQRPPEHVADHRLGGRRRLDTHRFRCNIRAEHRIERPVAVPAAFVLEQMLHGDVANARIDSGATGRTELVQNLEHARIRMRRRSSISFWIAAAVNGFEMLAIRKSDPGSTGTRASRSA